MSYQLYLEHSLLVKIQPLTLAKLLTSLTTILPQMLILQSRALIIPMNTFLNTSNINEIILHLNNLQTVRRSSPNVVSSLNINKASGPFSIPNKILILLKQDISKQLADLFNLSFFSGSSPSILKTDKVVPVFKKGSKLNCCNYRPISLLSNVEKILEKLMYKRVYNFLTENNIIYDLQFGFRQNFSTSRALINLAENIRQALD